MHGGGAGRDGGEGGIDGGSGGGGAGGGGDGGGGSQQLVPRSAQKYEYSPPSGGGLLHIAVVGVGGAQKPNAPPGRAGSVYTVAAVHLHSTASPLSP